MSFEYTYPGNMRTYTYSKREFLVASLRADKRLFCLVAVLYAIGIALIFRADMGGAYFEQPGSGLVYLLFLAGALSTLAFLVLLLRWQRIRKNSFLASAFWYGFDDEALYTSTETVKSRICWSYFSTWRELPGFFILEKPGNRQFLPKSIWSDEELRRLRHHLVDEIQLKKKKAADR